MKHWADREGRVAASQEQSGPGVIKLFFMLNSAEHEFFLLINVEMPTIVGISTFTSRENSILGSSEPEKCLIA